MPGVGVVRHLAAWAHGGYREIQQQQNDADLIILICDISNQSNTALDPISVSISCIEPYCLHESAQNTRF